MFVLGYLSPASASALRREANAYLKEKGSDGFFDVYRTYVCSCPACESDGPCLLLRLSEMFLHERKGYVLHETFSTSVLPLLDRLDASAEKKGKANIVLNEQGILTGKYVEEDDVIVLGRLLCDLVLNA